MSRADVNMKSHKMDLEEDFYAFDFDNEEEIPVYQTQDELLAALRQKEEEVILAAQLGNALLLENRQLKEETGKLHEQYAVKLEELEQGRHELRVRLGGCQAQWEGQVAELERDLQELSAQKQNLQNQLTQAQRAHHQDQQNHAEQTQLLQQQLQAAMEAESAVNAELQTLRQEVKDREHTHTQQDQELLNALREQVDRLMQKEQELEQRLQCVCEENLELKENLSSLHTRLTLNEQQSQQHVQQAAEAWREVEIARDRAQYLQQQLEALEEEASMQDSRHGNTSLLSELEHSLDTIGLDREQVTQDLASILQMLLPLTRGPQEPSVTHSHTHTGPQEPAITHSHKHTGPQEPAITHSHTRTGPEEPSVTHLHSHTHHTHTGPQEPDPRHSDLQGMMGQLKGLAQELAQQHTAQQLSGSIVGVGSDQGESSAQIQELKDQVCVLQEESAELRVLQERCRDQEEQLQQAIKDRDDAISKKTLMEAELVRSKNDMMSLNNQLLEAIQRKLQLSQELEAWQDDIQVILNQQLRTQHQWEQSQRKPLQAPPLSFLRRPRPHRLSTPPPCAPTPTPTAPSPWRDWLKRGK
ncbi:hypothetical protein ACEWY4_008473 [Coilia grayii]|uniref:Uncharacterized protein n=1 Tax=Coilia grayii TaxID=363190 RepID=A0ABD1KAY2_9TELE